MTQYATIAALQAYLDIGGTLDANTTTLLDSALTNASATIDDFTHQTFAAATNTTRFFGPSRDADGYVLWLDYPLCACTSIINGDGATIPLINVVYEPRNSLPIYAIGLLPSSGLMWTEDFAASPLGISVTGKWAYSLTPPAPIVQATLRLATWFYRQRDNALDLDRAVIVGNTTIAPSRIPADVITLIRPYFRKL